MSGPYVELQPGHTSLKGSLSDRALAGAIDNYEAIAGLLLAAVGTLA